MDIQNYLDRIKVDKIQKPDLCFLEKLMSQHLAMVPFENLYIRQKKKIVLRHEQLYTKIVTQKRGGFCYELNGLFYWLLENLGFSISIISAQVFNTSSKTFSPEYDHMALLVHLDNSYLVDVGFGDSVRKPISLPNGSAQDISGNYRISQQNQNQDQEIYLIQQHNGDKWTQLYRFTVTARSISDFNERCRYNSTSAESHFTQKTTCTIATTNGRITLTDKNLTITKDGEKRKIPVSSNTDFKQFLAQYFHLTF